MVKLLDRGGRPCEQHDELFDLVQQHLGLPPAGGEDANALFRLAPGVCGDVHSDGEGLPESARATNEHFLPALGPPIFVENSKVISAVLFFVDVPDATSGERVMEYPKFDHGAERAGRIPGAIHLFFRDILNKDDSYKSREELEAVFAGIGLSPGQDEEVVVYCRLSHRASLTWIAMHHILGFENVRIYDGSWTEWGSIVGFPIEK